MSQSSTISTSSSGSAPIALRSADPIAIPSLRLPKSSFPPVQLNLQKIAALATTNLVSVDRHDTPDRRTTITEVNESFKWTTARIGSLFKAIASIGEVTEQDIKHINELRKDLKDIESQLTETDKKVANSHIQNAYSELERLDKLRQLLPDYRKAEKKLEQTILDVTSHENGPLCSFDAANHSLDNFARLSAGIDTSSPLHPFLMETSKWLSDSIDLWAWKLQNDTAKELDHLERNVSDDPQNQATLQLLASLEERLWIANKSIGELITKAKELGLSDVAKSLQEANQRLGDLHNNHMPTLKLGTSSAPPVVYSSTQWKKLKEALPNPERGLIERAFRPAEWHDTTKDVVFRLMAASQLFQQGVGFYQQITNHEERRALADDLQKKMIAAVPPEAQKLIDKECSILERYLIEKYSALHNPATLTSLTKMHPEIRPALEHAMQHYGQRQPNAEEIKIVGDAYRLQRFVQQSPIADPTKHMSFGDWWNMFTSPEHQRAPEVKLLTAEQLPIAKTSAAISKAVSGAVQKLGNWLNVFRSSETAPSHQVFVNNTCSAKRVEVMQTVQKGREIHDQLAMAPSPNLEPLRQLVALSLGALMKNYTELSRNHLSLIELADLMQAINDQCFAIEELEKLIAIEMDKVREHIKGDISKLESGGRKHTNVVLQHRFVKALGIPGVNIPLPAAVESDKVHALFAARAPEIYEHWNVLNELYCSFEGSGQFLETEAAKEHLKAIDEAIVRAFDTEDAFEAMHPSTELRDLLERTEAAGDYLMIRSTGSEDTKEVANAGGNISRAYVSPTMQEFCQAVSDVVRSYFGIGSLQNHINAGKNPFEEELKLAVTAQRLIGEPVGGATDPGTIPTSLVLFSNEPLYIGNEKWRLMRISATFGHGEGVVGNQGIASDTYLLMASEVEPDKLYIIRDIKDKSERLAPVRNAEGKVVLGKIANPLELRSKPALSDKELARLYHYGVVSEKFFGDNATDMEIVVKKDDAIEKEEIVAKKGNVAEEEERTINGVQARPVNRPQMLPTYLDLHKIAALETSPVLQTLHSDLLVVGKASVVQIAKPEEILTAKTLEEAEKKYNKNLHKLVIVHQDEPANSHPVVNFSNLGVPCLVAKDVAAVNAITEGIRHTHSMAVCVQTGALHLWDSNKAPMDDFIVHGFGVHPAKLAISLPMPFLNPSQEPLREVPDEVKDLLIAVRAATTQQAVENALNKLQQSAWVSDVRVRAVHATHLLTESIHPELRQRFEAIANFAKKLNKAFAEAEKTASQLQSGQRLKPLFRAKVIESLLVGRGDKAGSLGQFSAVDIIAIDKDIEQLIAFQQQVGHSPHLMDSVLIGNSAMTPAATKQWTDFLIRIEQGIEEGSISQERVAKFKELLGALKSSEVVTPWLTFFFPQALQKAKTDAELLDKLIQTLPEKDTPFVAAHLQRQQEMQALSYQVDRFSDPKSFAEAWQTLQRFISPESLRSLTAEMSSRSPIARMIAISTMKQLVDLYDNAIKAFEGSDRWSNDVKVPLFKEMLKPFMILLRTCHEGVVRPGSIPTHSNWPIPSYLNELEKLLNNMPERGEEQLQPRREFDVSAAVLGSTTDFDRMLPERLVEAFTLIHQNLLSAIGSLNSDLFSLEVLEPSTLPESVKEALSAISKHYPTRLDLKVDQSGIVVKFNVPLRNHSGQVNLIYDRRSGQLLLEGQFFGPARQRWTDIRFVSNLLSDAGIMPMQTTPKQGEQSIAAIWTVTSPAQLHFILEEYAAMADYTMVQSLYAYLRGLIDRCTHDQLSDMIAPLFKYPSRAGLTLLTMLDGRGLQPAFEIDAYFESAIQAASAAVCNADSIIRGEGLELFCALIERDHLPAFEAAMETASAMTDDVNPGIRLVSVYLFWRLIDKDHQPAFEAATQAAFTATGDAHPSVRMHAFSLLWNLIKKDHEPAFGAAIEVASTATGNADLKDRVDGLELLIFLVEKGHQGAFEAATEAASATFSGASQSERGMAFSLFKMLIEEGYHSAFEAATQAASTAVGNAGIGIRENGLDMFRTLIDKDHQPAFEAATQAASAAARNADLDVRMKGLDMLNMLLERGHQQAFEAATQAASAAVRDADPDIRADGLGLFNKLFEQGHQQAFEAAAQAAATAVGNTDPAVRMDGLGLFYKLFEQGHHSAFEAATRAAATAVGNADPAVRLDGLGLFRTLIAKNQQSAFEAATQAAFDTAGDDDLNVRKAALDLFRDLLEKDYVPAFDVAKNDIATLMTLDPKLAYVLAMEIVNRIGVSDVAASTVLHLWSRFKSRLFG